MSNYRRIFRPGGTYFFTVVTYGREPILCTDRGRECLRGAIAECRERWPFGIIAFVLLPDHLHAIWEMSEGDCEYPRRWSVIKRRFTQLWLEAGGREGRVSAARKQQRGRGVWQRHYWEHTIRDEEDLEAHLHYIHYNPVKHGCVTCPHAWAYSSFHRLVEEGLYDSKWCCACDGGAGFVVPADVAGE